MSDESHEAALAIVKAQRDALAGVVAQVWDRAREQYECGVDDIEGWMTTAGLAQTWDAIEDDPSNGVEVGDPIIRLSDFGKAAMEATRP